MLYLSLLVASSDVDKLVKIIARMGAENRSGMAAGDTTDALNSYLARQARRCLAAAHDVPPRRSSPALQPVDK